MNTPDELPPARVRLGAVPASLAILLSKCPACLLPYLSRRASGRVL
ncbi:MAG: hypothetical protein OXU20_35190 [Myxococcales bacterium]|nr:hypothetical protein [Myxococcales bacterium]